MSEDIVRHYEAGREDQRLASGLGRLELLRTQEVLRRHLPSPPSSVIDVGGGTGIHAEWLAADGHAVHVVDLVPWHVEDARCRLGDRGVTGEVGDARALTAEAGSFDAALLLGPLYHLPDPADRRLALAEAKRVVRPGGLVAVAAINRFASLLDGLSSEHLFEPAFAEIVDADLGTGVHRNPDGHPGWFTTAYFHDPEELAAEVRAAGLDLIDLVGIEGMAIWLPHLAPRMDDEAGVQVLLDAARRIEREPALLGLSPHLLAIAAVPAG